MRYELAVEIARPPAEVYAYLADPAHLHDWQEDVEEVRDAPGGPLPAGATFTEVRSFLGKRAESTLEVTTAEPGRELSLRTVSGPVQVSIRHLLEPAGDGTLVLRRRRRQTSASSSASAGRSSARRPSGGRAATSSGSRPSSRPAPERRRPAEAGRGLVKRGTTRACVTSTTILAPRDADLGSAIGVGAEGAGLEPEPVVSRSRCLSRRHLASRFHPPHRSRVRSEVRTETRCG